MIFRVRFIKKNEKKLPIDVHFFLFFLGYSKQYRPLFWNIPIFFYSCPGTLQEFVQREGFILFKIYSPFYLVFLPGSCRSNCLSTGVKNF